MRMNFRFTIAAALLLLFPVLASAQYNPYYNYHGQDSIPDSPDGLSGKELFLYLHEVTGRNNHISAQKTAAKYMFSVADNIERGGVKGVLTAYSQIFVPGTSSDGKDYAETQDWNNDGRRDPYVNVEHSWPQHFFNSKMPMVGDLHHLQTTFMSPNSMRSSLPYCKVTNPIYSTSSGSKMNKQCFEPCDANKGNSARALLYFIVRYYDRLTNESPSEHYEFWVDQVPTLLEWNRQDPPDENELRRNDLVEQFQGNRNPFIDHPEYADRIGLAVFRAY